jgi:hypothetical protein
MGWAIAGDATRGCRGRVVGRKLAETLGISFISTMEAATIILTILTGVYSLLTFFILRANHAAVNAMQAQVEATTRPYVHFDLITKGVLIEFVLRNAGITAAFDVNVEMMPKVEVVLRNKRENMCLTSIPIAMLSPGREIRECPCSVEQLKTQCLSRAFSGTVMYRDGSGKSYKEPFRMDLSALENICSIIRPDEAEELRRAADELRDLRRDVADGLRNLKTH